MTWMEWQATDSDTRRVRLEFTRSMMESVPTDDLTQDPGDDYNPFPGVMKVGPSGPAVQARG